MKVHFDDRIGDQFRRADRPPQGALGDIFSAMTGKMSSKAGGWGVPAGISAGQHLVTWLPGHLDEATIAEGGDLLADAITAVRSR